MEAGEGGARDAAGAPNCVLIMFRRPPYGSVMAVEGFRMAEALLAFQVPLKVVFAEDGILNLLKGQGKGPLGMGDLGKAFAGLHSSGLPELIVVRDDLDARKLSLADLVEAPVTLVSACHLRKLMEESRVVIPF